MVLLYKQRKQLDNLTRVTVKPPNRTQFTAQRARGACCFELPTRSNIRRFLRRPIHRTNGRRRQKAEQEDHMATRKRLLWATLCAPCKRKPPPHCFHRCRVCQQQGWVCTNCSRLPTESLQTSSIGRPSNAGESPAAFWLRNHLPSCLGSIPRPSSNPPWSFSAEDRARETQHQSR